MQSMEIVEICLVRIAPPLCSHHKERNTFLRSSGAPLSHCPTVAPKHLPESCCIFRALTASFGVTSVAHEGRGEVHAGLWWGKSEWQEPLGRTRCRWEDYIEISFKLVGWGHGLDWSGSVYGYVVGFCECCNEHAGSIKCGDFLTSWGPLNFSVRSLIHGVS